MLKVQLLILTHTAIKNASQQSCSQGNFPSKKVCHFMTTKTLAELMSAEQRQQYTP